MLRFRFRIPIEPVHDYRPISFPPEGPYWCSGEDDTHYTLIAFSPSQEVLTGPERWPDAEDIDDEGEQPITFTERFPCPQWWEAK